MPKLLILSTGGALVIRRALGSRDEQPLTLRPDLAVTVEEFANLPGSHLTPQQVFALAQRILAVREGYDGIVVASGSDTLEETAYLLDLLLPDGPPLTITSLPRLNAGGAFASNGLSAAITVATTPSAANLGALVVVDDTIYPAQSLQTQFSQGVGMFTAAGGALGRVEGDQVCFRYRPLNRQHIAAPRLVEPVDLIRVGQGADDRQLRHSIADNVAGIVIETLGSGRVPPWWLPAIGEAIRQRIPVVAVSRAGVGGLGDEFGFVGAYHDLRKLGVIFAHDLSGIKARLKLMAALAVARSPAELRTLFR
ncbi:MAG: asparaginase [Chloroflexus sp.]|jgi:L-asparaginase|uniref:asparaginase n=1 Tax=Chloroflexus sp. TaxID=1904827 RepID=UPI0021DD2E98|nr:asparaginase [Chloroflexus sp.]GIV89467.1 MAG: asparaginase [Chloroflexus sp.]